MTPGQDTALTIRNTLLGGRVAGIATAGGVATGQAVWTLAASLGLTAVLVASESVFAMIRPIGASYLILSRCPDDLARHAAWSSQCPSAWTSTGRADTATGTPTGRIQQPRQPEDGDLLLEPAAPVRDTWVTDVRIDGDARAGVRDDDPVLVVRLCRRRCAGWSHPPAAADPASLRHRHGHHPCRIRRPTGRRPTLTGNGRHASVSGSGPNADRSLRAGRRASGLRAGLGEEPSRASNGEHLGPREGRPVVHPNRLLVAAAASVALLVILTGVALAQGALERQVPNPQHGHHRGRRDGSERPLRGRWHRSGRRHDDEGPGRDRSPWWTSTAPSQVTSWRPAAASVSPGRSTATPGSAGDAQRSVRAIKEDYSSPPEGRSRSRPPGQFLAA